MPAPKLKSCPFCGSEDLTTNARTYIKDGANSEYTYYVVCLYCGAHGSEERSKRSAIVAWNSRSNNAVED